MTNELKVVLYRTSVKSIYTTVLKVSTPLHSYQLWFHARSYLNIGIFVYFGFKSASTSQVVGSRNEMMMNDYDGQIFGDLVGLKLPDIRLTGEKNPEKTSPRKLVPTGDRTRARCVTSARATTCSTAVDVIFKLFFVFTHVY